LVEGYSPSLGSADARLEIVQYVDFSCPYSQQAYGPLREFVVRHSAEVRLAVRQFPIDELHPQARPAAVAAICAHRQGKFWPYYDRLFANQGSHAEADLVRYATQVGLDVTAWQACRRSPDAAAEVQRDYEDGVARGVPGTPTFFINGYQLSGALPLEAWEQVLDRLGR
jgi:protein-disulfide isomerase